MSERTLEPALSIPPADCTNHCGDGPCDCSGVSRVMAYTAESVHALVAERDSLAAALTEKDRHTFRLGGEVVTFTTRELHDEFMEVRAALTETQQALRKIEKAAPHITPTRAGIAQLAAIARAALADVSGKEGND